MRGDRTLLRKPASWTCRRGSKNRTAAESSKHARNSQHARIDVRRRPPACADVCACAHLRPHLYQVSAEGEPLLSSQTVIRPQSDPDAGFIARGIRSSHKRTLSTILHEKLLQSKSLTYNQLDHHRRCGARLARSEERRVGKE